jgi:hypothetical protein
MNMISRFEFDDYICIDTFTVKIELYNSLFDKIYDLLFSIKFGNNLVCFCVT